MSDRQRLAGMAFCALGVAALLGSAAAIPFVYESQSILYKFGADKVFLRSGKVVGLCSAVLLLLQLVLASRLSLLVTIFSQPTLTRWHRFNGMFVACLVMLHPLAVVAAEHFTLLRLEVKYWPEFVGIGLFLSLQVTVWAAVLQPVRHWSYPRWRLAHRLGAPLLILLLGVHLLFVSESFVRGVPRTAALCAMGAWAGLYLWVRGRALVVGNR